ncbi:MULTISPECIES: DUF2537 domain-containing protein [Nocardia]|uniref:DUF2537 domain-containing protein n=1 Tax=Nocardia implantans TaxID=3108168 RepID=A0ABU6AXW3_9NOCA|nr:MULTISPECIES: DUF2537 domain-containing protein [unclassified Nocardia]MBF6190614.1 DUF2537 domain-containing protein [Nocardia beijingensis]MEA3528526.1 DUF2537 domain-containing protein [Nocardia sp. CDC192]MEB3512322.1 DUF2537 domain-containing protein [Nocardia sp. CDC186]
MTEPYRPYRSYQDPTPWGAGLTVAFMVALLSAVAVYSFGAALAEVHPLLAVAVNLVAAGGAAPTAWRWRFTPVTRWVIGGGVAGVLLGWVVLVLEGLFG